ncbi:MAG: hypothetical protein M3N18_02130 [Actinomycetota bacterium]|nr:hypothetical protein [Actinomycetota bacterium]
MYHTVMYVTVAFTVAWGKTLKPELLLHATGLLVGLVRLLLEEREVLLLEARVEPVDQLLELADSGREAAGAPIELPKAALPLAELEAPPEPQKEPETVSEEPEGRGTLGRGAALLVAALVRVVTWSVTTLDTEANLRFDRILHVYARCG